MITNNEAEHIKILFKIIHKYFPECSITLFGSRTTNAFKPTSDLDLCLKDNAPLDLSLWAQLEEEISSLDITYKVDLVDWHRISIEFQEIIIQSQKKI
jgi:predicted nucleotidyltransferase